MTGPADPEPVRLDSRGRRINPVSLAALKQHQYKRGESGNPGGRRERGRLYGAVKRAMKLGRIRTNDPCQFLLNWLEESEG